MPQQSDVNRNDPFAAAKALVERRANTPTEPSVPAEGLPTDQTQSKSAQASDPTEPAEPTVGKPVPSPPTPPPTPAAQPQAKKPGRKNAGRPHPLQVYVDDEVDEFINAAFRTRRADGKYWSSKAELVNELLNIVRKEVNAKRIQI